MMTSCQEIITSLSLFGFMANLKQSGRWIPDIWSVKITFLLIVTFILDKLKTELKSSRKHSYYTITLFKGTIFAKKNADINKIKRVLVLKEIFSETTYVCVLTYKFQRDLNRV